MGFIEYKIAHDISRFFEDVRSEQSNEILGSKVKSAIKGNILYIGWLKKQNLRLNHQRKNLLRNPNNIIKIKIKKWVSCLTALFYWFIS